MTFCGCVARYPVQPKDRMMSNKHVMGTVGGRRGVEINGPGTKVYILLKDLYAPSTRVVWRGYDAECGFLNKKNGHKCTWYTENTAKNNFQIKRPDKW